MMKNEKGITLISLITTVIVLFILIGVSLVAVTNQLDEIRNKKLFSELGIVRQAVVEQYQKAVLLGKIETPKSENQLDIWVGTKITSRTGDTFFPGAVNAILEAQGITNAYMFTYNYNSENCVYQEDCCYLLEPADLEELGIEDAVHNYIVNYKTGEVYNESKQTDYNGKLLYTIPVNYTNQTLLTDTESFNDWSDF